MAITERVILSVSGGVEEWKDDLKVMLQTLKAQDGYLRTRWGPHSEDQQKLELLIGWESTEALATFKEVIDAHFVQMLTIEQGASSEDDLRAQVTKFKDLEGCTGVASGLSKDDVDGKGKVFIAAVGWESLEASEKAKESKVVVLSGAESHHVNFRFPIKGFRGL
ncbi:dimeric alpha-beta barrel containing protein [Botrytis cinerea]